MLGVVGATAYKYNLDELLKKRAADARDRLRDTFGLESRDHSIPFEWLSFEGDPVEATYLTTESRDLLVTGHDTAFRGNVHEQLSEIREKLLSMTPRPAVICPDEEPSTDEVLIAYDGSAATMRAIQLFALLGIGQSKLIHVTFIDSSEELAVRRSASGPPSTALRSQAYWPY